MSKLYKVDVRYVPAAGDPRVLERVDTLIDEIGRRGYVVTDASVFDDGARVSLVVGCSTGRIPQLAMLGIVSKSGKIGRFSCRDLDALEVADQYSHVQRDAVTA